VIEDAPAGVEAAHAAGMRVVAVTSTHSPGALDGADAVAARLLDIQIATHGQAHGPSGALLKVTIREWDGASKT
jgi:sugar-phosphatase